MLLSTGERVSMALLSIAIQALGEDAISFTGSQSGILTNDRHFDARIIEVRPHRIEDELARGRIVIIAGYRKDLDMFLDTNEGLRSRFTRSIDFPSYSATELTEIAMRMAEKRDSVFEPAAQAEMEQLFGHLATATTPDAAGVARRSLDIAGNGRFVRNVVERSEEEREFRLDHLGAPDFTDEELMTITAGDVAHTVEPLLRGLGLA